MKPYKTITLRLDAAHYARLTETARTAGLKIEPMLRQLIMGVNLRPRPPDTYAALLRELNAIGNNVNQLAYQANARGAATQDEIREAARLVTFQTAMSWRYGQLVTETERYSAIMDTAFNFAPLMLTQGEALILPPQIARAGAFCLNAAGRWRSLRAIAKCNGPLAQPVGDC